MVEKDRKMENPAPFLEKVLFLGTGTSNNVPQIPCLTDPAKDCRVCKSAMTPAGRMNRRRNTSILLLIRCGTERKHILVDCGKNFYEAALELFPKHNILTIDAILLTHFHMDAVGGLDDCRAWSVDDLRSTNRNCNAIANLSGLGSNSDGAFLPIYCSKDTYKHVSNMYPFMTDPNKATGSGLVPRFDWNVMDEDCESFRIPNVWNISLKVLPAFHGFIFDSDRGIFGQSKPFIYWGYRIDDFSYISDSHEIPPETARLMEDSRTVVLDSLRYKPHTSHFSVDQAIDFVRNNLTAQPEMVLLTGMCHSVDHYQLTTELEEKSTSEQQLKVAYDGMLINFGKCLMLESHQ